MPIATQKILLVTPVWNDSARLAGFGASLAAALAACSLPVRWVIADDGSGGSECDNLTKLCEQFGKLFPAVSVHFATRHGGKGAVVREAWLLEPDAEWFAFVDADGSVTAEDFLELLRVAVADDISVLGIRQRTSTTVLVESFWRGLAHRGYLALCRRLLGLTSQDTQCGAKVIRGDDYRRIRHRLIEDGLAFDSELLFSLARAGSSWREVAVSWEEKKGGKVSVWRDGWGVLMALIRMSRRPW